MNWRARKKHLRNMTAGLERHGYFEDCNYHPCRMTRIDPYRTSQPWTRFEAGVDGISLVDGRTTGCSLYNCSPPPLTQAEAEERAAVWLKEGELAHHLRYIYVEATPAQIEELIESFKS